MVQKTCACKLGGGRCAEPVVLNSIFCEYCNDHGFHYHCTRCSTKYVPGSDSDTLCSQCQSAGKDEVIK